MDERTEKTKESAAKRRQAAGNFGNILVFDWEMVYNIQSESAKNAAVFCAQKGRV